MMDWFRQIVRHEVLAASIRVLGWSGLAVITNGVSGVFTARILAVDDKGILTLVLSVGGLLFVLTSLGTNIAFRVELPRPDSWIKAPDYLQVSLKLLFLHVGASALLIWLATRYIGGFSVTPLFLGLVLLLSILVFTSSQSLDALHAFTKSSVATRSDALGALITMLLLLVVFGQPTSGWTLTWIVACYAAGFGARTAIAGREVFLLHQASLGRLASAGDRAGGAQSRLVRMGASFLGYNVGQTVAFRIDRYLLGIVANPRALGLYSVAATPAEMLRLPVTAFSQIIMQRAAAQGVSRRLVVQSCLATAAITIPPAVVLFIFAGPIIRLLFGSRYSGAEAVLQVMVIAELVVAFFLVVSRIGAAAGLGRAMGIAAIGGAICAVGALFVLAPYYGAVGAAWASVVGNSVMTAICLAALVSRTRRDLVAP